MAGSKLKRGAATAACLLILAACRAPRLERYDYSEHHMGTTFRVVLYAPSAEAAERAADAAFERIAELDARLSDYRADSELSLLCAQSDVSAPTAPIRVSHDLWTVLARSQEVARASDGAFDVTVGPCVELWRRARRQGEFPSDERLARAALGVGWRKLGLDRDARSVRLLAPNMRLDLGGIAKGYALDEALRTLESHAVERALVVGGGDVRAGRAPPNRTGWTIALDPFDGETPADEIKLEHGAVSTSGDAFQALELDGERYSHIVDPRSGRALSRRTAATVIARASIDADALATALCVLGSERGLELIARTPGTHARVTTLENTAAKSRESPGFRSLMLLATSPAPIEPNQDLEP